MSGNRCLPTVTQERVEQHILLIALIWLRYRHLNMEIFTCMAVVHRSKSDTAEVQAAGYAVVFVFSINNKLEEAEKMLGGRDEKTNTAIDDENVNRDY